MERVVSVKAAVAEVSAVEGRLFDLTDSLGTSFEQTDVYFGCERGTLKMRLLPPSKIGQMISGRVLGIEGGVRLLQQQAAAVEEVDALRETLAAALGEIGRVTKTRRVFNISEARIYLDDVKGLGHFLEIIVTSADENSDLISAARARELAEELGFASSALLPLSYIELLSPTTALQRQPQRS